MTETLSGPQTIKTISLDQAQRVIEAAIQYTREHSLPPMYVLVVDADGRPTASARMDGNALASVDLVPAKAYSACVLRTATADLNAGLKDPGSIATVTATGMSLLPGGRPIIQDGVVIGAVSVGGSLDPAENDEVALAGVNAL